MERATGFEPATICLEGRDHFNNYPINKVVLLFYAKMFDTCLTNEPFSPMMLSWD